MGYLHIGVNEALLVSTRGSMDIGGIKLIIIKSDIYFMHEITKSKLEVEACPEFHVGCRLGRELFTLSVDAIHVHGAMGCDQESFIIVWW